MTQETTMPLLVIEATGAITSSNFDAFATAARQWLAGINRVLKEDDDFTQADADAKKAKEVEDMLATTREAVLEKAETLNAELTRLSELSGEMRDARLTLTRQIDKAKEDRRKQIIDAELGMLECDKSMRESFRQQIADSTKGKKSMESMRDATRVTRNIINDRIARAKKMIAECKAEHGDTVAPDSRSLECSDPVWLESELRRRVEVAAAEKEKARLREEAEAAKRELEATRQEAAKERMTKDAEKLPYAATLPPMQTIAIGPGGVVVAVADACDEWAKFRDVAIESMNTVNASRKQLRDHGNFQRAAAFWSDVITAWKGANQ